MIKSIEVIYHDAHGIKSLSIPTDRFREHDEEWLSFTIPFLGPFALIRPYGFNERKHAFKTIFKANGVGNSDPTGMRIFIDINNHSVIDAEAFKLNAEAWARLDRRPCDEFNPAKYWQEWPAFNVWLLSLER